MARRAGAYRSLVLPVLSRLEPERAHRAALRCLSVAQSTSGGLRLLKRFAAPDDPRLHIRRFGLDFAHPIGTAAGMDKDAEAVTALLAVGFASVEVGTVTPKPQPGNPPPRVWRLREEAALINRLGFPSVGAAAVGRRLKRSSRGVLGVNVSTNRSTPRSRAPEDCATALSALAHAADYATLNISSPNTPGLRNLQERSAVIDILNAMKSVRPALPILVKLSPDLAESELDEALQGIQDGGAAGVVISNTTTRGGRGGLSGPPLKALATSLVRRVRRWMGRSLPIVGVGGVGTVEDVIERMRAGASLVQLYTAFVYEGPGLPGRLARGLSRYLDREGVRKLEDLVGVDA